MAKTVLITGASAGIGRAAALALASAGNRIIGVGRSSQDLESLRREMISVAPNAAEQSRVIVSDFASLRNVRALADEILASEARLDVLVNNAGIQPYRRAMTEDGFESAIAVNHMSHFSLSSKLAPLLRESEGRIVVTASSSHLDARLDLSDFNLSFGWTPMGAYGRSKLANILFASRAVTELGVPTSSFHPGDILTAINRDYRFVSITKPFERFRFQAPAIGADTLVWLASSSEGAKPRHLYYVNREPSKVSDAASDPFLADRLWSLSAELLSKAETSRSLPSAW